jgi:hypothetical protein
MGYLVNYKFHPEISKGEYDKEDMRTANIKVGSPYEDVPLEVLAGKVMALLARRSVLVVDVEIMEITKKPLAFKEVEDGIVIKNKKFRFDDGPALSGGEEIKESPEAQLTALLQTHPNLAQLLNPATQPHNNLPVKRATPQQAPLPPGTGTPVRYEFYRPDDTFWEDYAKGMIKDYAFTVGKQYPILAEKTRPIAKSAGGTAQGIFYETVDDKGRKQLVPNQLFTPKISRLEHEDSAGGGGLTDDGLYWGDANGDVPELRKR